MDSEDYLEYLERMRGPWHAIWDYALAAGFKLCDTDLEDADDTVSLEFSDKHELTRYLKFLDYEDRAYAPWYVLNKNWRKVPVQKRRGSRRLVIPTCDLDAVIAAFRAKVNDIEPGAYSYHS